MIRGCCVQREPTPVMRLLGTMWPPRIRWEEVVLRKRLLLSSRASLQCRSPRRKLFALYQVFQGSLTLWKPLASSNKHPYSSKRSHPWRCKKFTGIYLEAPGFTPAPGCVLVSWKSDSDTPQPFQAARRTGHFFLVGSLTLGPDCLYLPLCPVVFTSPSVQLPLQLLFQTATSPSLENLL